MDVLQILSLISIVIGIIGLAGGAVGYFAKGRGDSIIAYQAKQLELYKDDNVRLEKALAATTAERDSFRETIKTLESLAQGSPSLEKLAKQISRVLNRLEKNEAKLNKTKGKQ